MQEPNSTIEGCAFYCNGDSVWVVGLSSNLKIKSNWRSTLVYRHGRVFAKSAYLDKGVHSAIIDV